MRRVEEEIKNSGKNYCIGYTDEGKYYGSINLYKKNGQVVTLNTGERKTYEEVLEILVKAKLLGVLDNDIYFMRATDEGNIGIARGNSRKGILRYETAKCNIVIEEIECNEFYN